MRCRALPSRQQASWTAFLPRRLPENQAPAASGELDRIVAVVNNDIITEHELEQRVHTVAINLRRQNIQLPAMELLRAQVLERLISERAILQRARQTASASTTRW